MIHRLKNIGAEAYTHNRSSIGFPVGEYVIVNDTDRWYFHPEQDGGEMWAKFLAGTIIFNDGVADYTNAYEGFHRFLYAFGIPFLSTPNRSNLFPSNINNVQLACEFLRTVSSGGGLGIIACGFDGTGSTGRWLEFITNSSSDNVPWIVANASYIAALALDGARTGSYTGTVTMYKNNVALDTISLSAQYKNRKVGLTHVLAPLDEIKFQVTSGSISKPMIWVYTGA